MPAPSFGSLSSAGAWRTCTTTMRFFRRWAMTSSRLGSSILSLTSSPLSVRAVYWKSGMARGSSRRLPAGPYFGHADLRLPARPERLPLVHHGLADHPQEIVRVGCGAEALLLRDLAGDVQLVQRVVQRLHAVLLPRLHRGLDLVHLVVADQRADRRGAHHDLGRHHATPSLVLLEQRLGDHSLEHERELRPRLRLSVRREHVHDAA